ncbi:hypothetical protein AAHC03_05252 [Spirometra sp. Aus1]
MFRSFSSTDCCALDSRRPACLRLQLPPDNADCLYGHTHTAWKTMHSTGCLLPSWTNAVTQVVATVVPDADSGRWEAPAHRARRRNTPLNSAEASPTPNPAPPLPNLALRSPNETGPPGGFLLRAQWSMSGESSR